MTDEDIRWQQRFSNFKKASGQLSKAVELSKERALTELEQQGLVQVFEFTHELAWNVIKDYFQYLGNTTLMGSRDSTREAFSKGLVLDGEAWMEMISSRNMSTHTYNEETALEIVKKICGDYNQLFKDFQVKMEQIIAGV